MTTAVIMKNTPRADIAQPLRSAPKSVSYKSSWIQDVVPVQNHANHQWRDAKQVASSLDLPATEFSSDTRFRLPPRHLILTSAEQLPKADAGHARAAGNRFTASMSVLDDTITLSRNSPSRQSLSPTMFRQATYAGPTTSTCFRQKLDLSLKRDKTKVDSHQPPSPKQIPRLRYAQNDDDDSKSLVTRLNRPFTQVAKPVNFQMPRQSTSVKQLKSKFEKKSSTKDVKESPRIESETDLPLVAPPGMQINSKDRHSRLPARDSFSKRRVKSASKDSTDSSTVEDRQDRLSSVSSVTLPTSIPETKTFVVGSQPHRKIETLSPVRRQKKVAFDLIGNNVVYVDNATDGYVCRDRGMKTFAVAPGSAKGSERPKSILKSGSNVRPSTAVVSRVRHSTMPHSIRVTDIVSRVTITSVTPLRASGANSPGSTSPTPRIARSVTLPEISGTQGRVVTPDDECEKQREADSGHENKQRENGEQNSDISFQCSQDFRKVFAALDNVSPESSINTRCGRQFVRRSSKSGQAEK